MNEFKEFNLSSEVINDLKSEGIINPTIVQQKVIPLINQGNDVLVQSATGSGKTIGFAIPTIELIKPEKRVQALVITPTRELTKQVGEEYYKFSASKGLNIAIVYGGVSINNQLIDVSRADVVIGTPGRLLDLINRGALDLSRTEFLVLDEADRLLDMGFIDDIDKIISYMKGRKQTLLFSATINNHVSNLASRYLSSPKEVFLDNKVRKGKLNQSYYNVKEHHKLSALAGLLGKFKDGLVLIFCNTKYKTKFVSRVLRFNNINAKCLNGDMTQHMREQVMSEFADGGFRFLVATDVAARGLHVDNINLVVNYDLHESLDNYTHRVGRTARNGCEGTAITLLSERDWHKMDKVISKYGKELVEMPFTRFDRVRIPRKPNTHNNRQRFRRSKRL